MRLDPLLGLQPPVLTLASFTSKIVCNFRQNVLCWKPTPTTHSKRETAPPEGKTRHGFVLSTKTLTNGRSLPPDFLHFLFTFDFLFFKSLIIFLLSVVVLEGTSLYRECRVTGVQLYTVNPLLMPFSLRIRPTHSTIMLNSTASQATIMLTSIFMLPMARLQHKFFQTGLMMAK